MSTTTPPAVMPAAPSDAEILACFADTKADGQGAYMLAVGRAVLALSQTMQPQTEPVMPATVEGKYALWVKLSQDPELAPIAAALGEQLRLATPAAGEQAGAVTHSELLNVIHALMRDTKDYGQPEVVSKRWAEEVMRKCARAAPGAAIAAREQYADWLWGKLMDFFRKRGFAPADFNDLFAIVSESRRPTKAEASREEAPATPQVETLTLTQRAHVVGTIRNQCGPALADRLDAILKGVQPVER